MSHKESFIVIFAYFAEVRLVCRTPCLFVVIDSCGSLFPCCLLQFSGISMGHMRLKGRPMVRPDDNNTFADLFSPSQLETKFTTLPSSHVEGYLSVTLRLQYLVRNVIVLVQI